MHPCDRCTTVAEFDDETIEGLTRRARNLETGKTYLVDKNISFEQWKKQNLINEQDKANKRYNVKEQSYFIDSQGNKYNIDGKNVFIKANKKEREIAKLLAETYKVDVNLVPVVLNPPGIKTPDYVINNEKFDLKEILGNSKNTLYNAITRKKEQSDNFIFDITRTTMSETDAMEQVENIYNSKHKDWVNKIILIKENKLIKEYKRK